MLHAIRRHLNPATVLALIAVVFAMTGGAYAAGLVKITSIKQISPKVQKALKGANGKNGAAGTAGVAGPQGPAGTPGANGINGKDGKDGKDGEKGLQGNPGGEGTEGPEGQPWTPNNTLPKGAEETGTWIAPANPTIEEFATISFPIQLASTLDSSHVVYITLADVEKEEIPAGCAGTPESPVAEAGFLCVFEGELSSPVGSAEEAFIIKPGGKTPGASKTGALILLASKAAEARFIGTWAVRAG